MTENQNKSVSDSETTLTELMIPSYSNFGGKVHGGILLSLMDKVAYACATKHSESYCVTVAVEGVEFLSPVEVGDLLSLKASVNYVGNSSMIIGIRVEAQNPLTRNLRHTNTCYFTMVAKNEHGELKKVPGLALISEEEVRRFVEGIAIKKINRTKRQLLDEEIDEYSFDRLVRICDDERCTIRIGEGSN